MSSVKRAKDAVYDTKYHLVWIPKYRKNMFKRDMREYIKQRGIPRDSRTVRVRNRYHGSDERSCAPVSFCSAQVLSSPNCPDREEHIGQTGLYKVCPSRKRSLE